jgi:hypothetical protein
MSNRYLGDLESDVYRIVCPYTFDLMAHDNYPEPECKVRSPGARSHQWSL